jgi:hypothetical protein
MITWADMILEQNKWMTLRPAPFDALRMFRLQTEPSTTETDPLKINYLDSSQGFAGGLLSNVSDLNLVAFPTLPSVAEYLAELAKDLEETSVSSIPRGGLYLQDLERIRTSLRRLPVAPAIVQHVVVKEIDLFEDPLPRPVCIAKKSVSFVAQVAIATRFLKELGAPALFRASTVSQNKFLRAIYRQVCRLIRLIKRTIFEPEPTFCGLGWCRRLWFLLHGSHPPKALASLPA